MSKVLFPAWNPVELHDKPLCVRKIHHLHAKIGIHKIDMIQASTTVQSTSGSQVIEINYNSIVFQQCLLLIFT